MSVEQFSPKILKSNIFIWAFTIVPIVTIVMYHLIGTFDLNLFRSGYFSINNNAIVGTTFSVLQEYDNFLKFPHLLSILLINYIYLKNKFINYLFVFSIIIIYGFPLIMYAIFNSNPTYSPALLAYKFLLIFGSCVHALILYTTFNALNKAKRERM